MKAFHKFIATGFGSGYFPVAPGTAGAALGVALLWGLHELYFHYFTEPKGFLLVFILIFLVFFVAGVWSTDHLEKEWGKDPSRVVMDEIIGLWLTMIFVPINAFNLFLAFALFRLFDIWKPLGIRQMERLKGGLGVMMDDVVAGLYANVCLQLILQLCF